MVERPELFDNDHSKKVKDLHSKNCKTPKKEIEKDIRK